MLNLLFELVRKDLRIFVMDRRSVIISFAIPVILACFVGFLMSQGGSGEAKKVQIVVADQDRSDFSKGFLDRLKQDKSFDVQEAAEADAAGRVRHGDVPLAVVIPEGFGKAAAAAMVQHTAPPQYRFLADPTKTMQVGMAQGELMRITMQVLPKIAFGAVAPSEGNQMPFTVKTDYQTSDKTPQTSMAAHAFAGMGIQGLLFWAIESAMTILTERKQGIWRRLRASPVSPWMFILGKALSATIRALAILFVVFGAGTLLFHFHIRPDWRSYFGFGAIAVAISIMTATFGLLVASLGRNAQQSRGLSTLAVLGMSMLGGAWFPMDFMPSFMQNISKVIPVAWAINGFDDMIWRGGGLREAALAVVVLLGFSIAFTLIAVKRISWEPEAG
jgi:ABC-2 type transport system permease protein